MNVHTRQEVTQDRISQLAGTINDRLRESIADIQDVNDDIHVLSVNAKIQAARAGDSGKGFGVVADMVRGMVTRTQDITDRLQRNVESTVGELLSLNSFLGTKVRGERLSQVASTMIDIVDRNLYERSCDVRWWATEDAVVRALSQPTAENLQKASHRLGVILDSYTVYLDIVLCDLSGVVLANGRPEQYKSVGSKVDANVWFHEARRSKNGTEFGFEGVHLSPLVNDKSVLVYSCAVRKDGESSGEQIGVLGVVFNWAGLGNVVVEHAEDTLAAETENHLHAHLFYPDGTVIASRGGRGMLQKMNDRTLKLIDNRPLGTILPDSEKAKNLVAGFALSQGFETYRTGWYAIILEEQN